MNMRVIGDKNSHYVKELNAAAKLTSVMSALQIAKVITHSIQIIDKLIR